MSIYSGDQVFKFWTQAAKKIFNLKSIKERDGQPRQEHHNGILHAEGRQRSSHHTAQDYGFSYESPLCECGKGRKEQFQEWSRWPLKLAYQLLEEICQLRDGIRALMMTWCCCIQAEQAGFERGKRDPSIAVLVGEQGIEPQRQPKRP